MCLGGAKALVMTEEGREKGGEKKLCVSERLLLASPQALGNFFLVF